MNQAEIEALAIGIAPAIRDAIAKAVQPLVVRIAQLEARKPEKGEPGLPGKDGRDGFSLDDFDMERGEDGRTYVLKFTRGEVRHEYEWELPTPAYCGVFKEGTEYRPGDMVTWGGSVWHCDKATTVKPDCGDWTLAVKRGRDGKDAKSNG